MAKKKFVYEYRQKNAKEKNAKKGGQKSIPQHSSQNKNKWAYSFERPSPAKDLSKPARVPVYGNDANNKKIKKEIKKTQKPARKGYRFTPRFIIHEKRTRIALAALLVFLVIDAIVLVPQIFPPKPVVTEIKRGLSAEYFTTLSLDGNATNDTVPSLNLNFSSLPSGINPEHFSARYTGIILIMADGDYSFQLDSDDGARLYIDNQLVIDTWSNAGNSSGFAFLQLSRLGHYITAEYRNDGGPGFLQLDYWSDKLNITKQPVPDKYFKRYEVT